MHRTTTTATLLVTVAVSALTGCVTVQRPPASAPVPGPSQPSAPRPDGRAEPQIVQAPADEALERIGPHRRPESRTRPTQRSTPAAPAAPAGQPATPRSHPRPAHPEHRRPERPAPQRPPVEIPDVTESVRKNTDVCALGNKYGGWRKDSPEATICEQTYSR